MTTDSFPLTGPPPREVPLARAPLVQVLAQVRFPVIASIEKREFIASFQEAIRNDYPVLRPEQNVNVVFGNEGPSQERSNTWRFTDETATWRVSLAAGFLALETKAYVSREDFLSRLTKLLAALVEHVNPRVVDRLGLRYIDQLSGEALDHLPDLVRPAVAGILASPLAAAVQHSITQSSFEIPEESGQLMARWGFIPAGATVDPNTIEAVDFPSWILDVDAFSVQPRPFQVDGVIADARALSERVYAVFRWAVTPAFLERFGGQA